jgi:hypothetical protein
VNLPIGSLGKLLEKPLLGPRSRRVLITNDRDQAELRHTSEHPGRDIGATWVVADIFSEQFFAPVRRCEARFNRYLRNG